mgnify:CR=1 FL=1
MKFLFYKMLPLPVLRLINRELVDDSKGLANRIKRSGFVGRRSRAALVRDLKASSPETRESRIATASLIRHLG